MSSDLLVAVVIVLFPIAVFLVAEAERGVTRPSADRRTVGGRATPIWPWPMQDDENS